MRVLSVDIATLRWDHLKQISGDWFIERKREKTSHQNDKPTRCYLWPETKALLDQYAATKNNKYELVLLNENGAPLVTIKNSETNNITNAFQRTINRLKWKRRFKDFRKSGATWMENHVGVDVSRMYRANKPGGTDALYINFDFEKLTAALKKWREELKAANVF